MNTRLFPLVAVLSALFVAGAGCAPRPTANVPATTPPPQTAEAPSQIQTPPQAAAGVTQGDLDKLKTDIQGAKFDDLSALKQ